MATTIDVSALRSWLLESKQTEDGGATFVRELAERLVAAGFPLWRASCALMTMHPEILWRTIRWREDEPVAIRDQSHERLLDAFYTASAVAVVRQRRQRVRVPLVAGDLPYPICVDLRAEGGTDYVVEPLAFTNGDVSYISFATQSPGGFSAAALAALEELRPFIARRIELESSYYATTALLDVYLGKNAARRVLAGAFQRGRGEMIDAAIWFSDMRDFTALSDRASPQEVIETLDQYFDAAANAIASHGGEVLKFIGDAILAIFPIEKDATASCKNALAAAEEALGALGALNHSRRARGETEVRIGVALHRGNVMYGNIGARNRLDFTVISAAVNEASRLEALCKKLGTPLALSETFAKTAEATGIADLGAHELKGVKEPLRVYTLERFVSGS
ncbi:MAG TPA: adenylate/guanylate cyclase domain-containing protein [Polyangiaceae bacterium]